MIKIITSEKVNTVPFIGEMTISDLLLGQGIDFAHPCAGKGICGKCVVRATGNLSAPDETEKKHLSTSHLNGGQRLACRTKIHGDCVIDCRKGESDIYGITEGVFSDFNRLPLTGERDCYGAAVDIGTTTVAIYIFKLPECASVYSNCKKNRQTAYGADVISRIEYSMKNGHGALTQTIVAQIEEMIAESGYKPEYFVVTGNTVMLHLLCGIDPSSMGQAPYTPTSLFGYEKNNTYLPECISAFVGADITCAVVASGMLNKNHSLLIDIGTNGEIVYNDNGRLLCCSTAAGPALEGAGISQGMPATSGAINKVYTADGKLEFTTIGGAEPVGICGSGIVDAVACLLETGYIDESGYIEEKVEIANSGVFITPEDIRAVQLAKAAIRAGIETVCNNTQNISAIYLAGGFGSYLDIKNCIRTGLLPENAFGKTVALGNAAGTGASMLLMSRECLEKAKIIAEKSETADLATSSEFFDNYVKYMLFD